MVVRAVTRRLPARPSVLGSLSTANWSCVKALRLEARRVFPPCPMENRAAAAHAETSKTWTPPARSRRASPDRSRPTQGPGRLRPGGRNNTSTVAKTRRQDMHGQEHNDGVDQYHISRTQAHWAGKTRPTSVAPPQSPPTPA